MSDFLSSNPKLCAFCHLPLEYAEVPGDTLHGLSRCAELLVTRVAELEGELDKYGRSGWYQRVKELTAELEVERQRVTALQENLGQFVAPGQPVETDGGR